MMENQKTVSSANYVRQSEVSEGISIGHVWCRGWGWGWGTPSWNVNAVERAYRTHTWAVRPSRKYKTNATTDDGRLHSIRSFPGRPLFQTMPKHFWTSVRGKRMGTSTHEDVGDGRTAVVCAGAVRCLDVEAEDVAGVVWEASDCPEVSGHRVHGEVVRLSSQDLVAHLGIHPLVNVCRLSKQQLRQ